MKSSMLFVVFSLAVAPALAAPFQDLDRIDEIVKQARGLADRSRSSGLQTSQPVSDPATDQRQFGNPFARGATHGVAGQSSPRPRVGVGVDAIRIDAGGRQFTIPRVGGANEGDDVDPHMAAPARNARTYSSALGQSANVEAALESAGQYRIFADATRLFRNGEYSSSLAAIGQTKSGGAMGPIEQFHALCLFANGDYMKSAELAYSAVANTSFYSWEQLRQYYGNPDQYAQQYLKLQEAVAKQSSDPSLRFLLGYHHLMLGHREHAAREFEFVLTQLPGDPVVRNLLQVAQALPPSPVN